VKARLKNWPKDPAMGRKSVAVRADVVKAEVEAMMAAQGEFHDWISCEQRRFTRPAMHTRH
jgi:hypothetical protein